DSSKTALIEEIEAKGYKTAEEIDALIKTKMADIEAAVVDLKKAGLKEIKPKAKGFKAIIGAALTEAKADLLAMVQKSGGRAEVMLYKADEDLNDANFSGDSLEIATTDRSRGLYTQPYMPQWFRNLLPSGTTSKGTIQYLKENGDVGAAGVWDGTGAIADLDAKPGTAPLFASVTENVIWIAGITRVKREMLDDIEWLQGYLARRLTTGRTGLWVAENVQIFNKLVANSVPYDGDKTIPIEMIYDAAFGQLADNYYFNPTILMNNRDLVGLIALNKATGSGEYDLPPGTVVVINGQLTIAGARVIGAPNVTAGTALVYDASATEFISRMSPEVRFFEEDRDNVIKNLVTVRAEERILPIVYDEKGVIEVTFATT
ncbi:MAG TPA: phage major capsid protein, partial [Flavobacterium sp.]|nr:phage major capsid protein [Flavobacterium sp.]